MKEQDNEAVFSLRLPARLAERLKTQARLRSITISRMAREAIAAGLAARSRAGVTYGCSSVATLSIVLVGIGLPETWTTGGLALKIDLIATEEGPGS